MSKRRSNRKNPPVPRPEETLSEKELQRIESQPEFRRMMRESEEHMRAGRFITHEEAMRRIQAGRGRSR